MLEAKNKIQNHFEEISIKNKKQKENLEKIIQDAEKKKKIYLERETLFEIQIKEVNNKCTEIQQKYILEYENMLQKNNQLQKELDDMKTMHMNQEKLVKK